MLNILSGYWRIVLTLIGTVVLAGFIAFMFLNSYSSDSNAMTLTETLRSTALSNKDDAARISPGEFYMDKENFEKEFSESILKQPLYKGKKVEITFDYLKTNDQKGVKGIKVFVEADGVIDQATCVLSKPGKE